MVTKRFVFILQKKWLKAMKNKKFNCVKMKWDIQRRIAEEFASVSDEEAHRVQMERVVSDPILGPFCKEVGAAKKASSK